MQFSAFSRVRKQESSSKRFPEARLMHLGRQTLPPRLKGGHVIPEQVTAYKANERLSVKHASNTFLLNHQVTSLYIKEKDNASLWRDHHFMWHSLSKQEHPRNAGKLFGTKSSYARGNSKCFEDHKARISDPNS